MKKVVVLLCMAVLGTGAFAFSPADVVRAANIQKAVEQAALQAAEQQACVEELQGNVKARLESFKKFAYNRAYYEYGMLFQGMDGLRRAYLKLHEASAEAAQALVQEINEPIVIDQGKREIRIADFVRMESCMIDFPSEEARWEAWSNMLEEDLKAVR